MITIGKEFKPYSHVFQVKIPECINLISLATDDLASQGIQDDLLNINEIPYFVTDNVESRSIDVAVSCLNTCWKHLLHCIRIQLQQNRIQIKHVMPIRS